MIPINRHSGGAKSLFQNPFERILRQNQQKRKLTAEGRELEFALACSSIVKTDSFDAAATLDYRSCQSQAIEQAEGCRMKSAGIAARGGPRLPVDQYDFDAA